MTMKLPVRQACIICFSAGLILSQERDKASSGTNTTTAATEISTFARALTETTSEQESNGLLEQNRGLITGDLARELLKQGKRPDLRGNLPKKLKIFVLAQQVAQTSGDRPALSTAVRAIGDVRTYSGSHHEA